MQRNLFYYLWVIFRVIDIPLEPVFKTYIVNSNIQLNNF